MKAYLINTNYMDVASYPSIEKAEETGEKASYTYDIVTETKELVKRYTAKELQKMWERVTGAQLVTRFRTKSEAAEKIFVQLEKMELKRMTDETETKAPKAPKKRNGAVAKLHALFTEMGPDTVRKDALAAAVEQGFNKATASTQFQKWKKALQA